MKQTIKEALQIKSVKRTLNIFAVLSLLVAAAPTANLSAAAEAADNGCFRHNTANATMNESGNSVTARFTVPKNCNDKDTHRVSLVVYEIRDCNWMNKVNNQFIYSSKTVDVKVGTHSISTNLPVGNYQADLVKGNPVNIATGADQGHILVAKVGHQCQPATPAPAPTPPTAPTPATPTTVNTNINTNTATATATSTPATPAAATAEETFTGKDQPTALVNTGPGDVAAAFVGVSALGSLGYQVLVRRRLGLNS